jgi:hypothetical protein
VKWVYGILCRVCCKWGSEASQCPTCGVLGRKAGLRSGMKVVARPVVATPVLMLSVKSPFGVYSM